MARIPKEPHDESDMSIPPPMIVTLHEIPNGVQGTRATLEKMRDIIWRDVKDRKYGAILRQLAIKITIDANCKTKDFHCEAKAIYEWVRDHIKWIRDIKNYETLQHAYRTLSFGGGDCDDLTILMCALWISIGHPCALVAICANPQKRNVYTHVFGTVSPTGSDDGPWISADPTVKSIKTFGWSSPVKYHEMILRVD